MTPLREKIVNNAAPYLRPGEQVQGAFAGQSISGWWSLLTYLMFFRLRFRAVLVTDQRILVLDTGKWSATNPKSVVAELPRNVVIGPPKGLWWKCLTLGEKLFVHKRFHKDIRAADTILAESGQPVQQIPLGGHRPQPGPVQGQQFAAPADQQQYGVPSQQYGQPGQYGQPAQPGQQPQQYGGQQDQQQWSQQGQPGQPQQQWEQPGQPQQWEQQGQPQQYDQPQGQPQWAQQPQPGQPQQWAQPDPQATPQAPASGSQSQEQPSPWNRDPRLEEPDEDNRTRIRPAAPRPDQERPES